MAHYPFTINQEGWSAPGAPGFEWTNADGSPAGCLVAGDPEGGDPGTNSDNTSITGLSIPVVNGDPFSCRFKFVRDGGGSSGVMGCSLTLNGGEYTASSDTFSVSSGVPSDTGWLTLSGTITGTDTITSIEFSANGAGDGVQFVIYFDEVYVAESPASPFGFTRSAGGLPGAVMVSE